MKKLSGLTVNLHLDILKLDKYIEREEMKIPLLLIVGPTAVGKTELSIILAKKFNGEIISGDSMQVYKLMDIGTAKITKDEMQNIPHHMIDIVYPDYQFSAAEFQSRVTSIIKDIWARGHLPIIVGGTGLYIESLLFEYNFPKIKKDDRIREYLSEMAKMYGNDYLYQMLKKIDPQTALRLHPNDLKRIIRAIEVYKLTGKTMEQYLQEQNKNNIKDKYDYLLIGLTYNRSELYDRINRRVDIMVENGLINEVDNLLKMGYDEKNTAMQGLGYKELIPYIEDKKTLTEAIEEIKKRTRNFAKRQLSWFRHMNEIIWFNYSIEEKEKINNRIIEIVEGKYYYLNM